MYQVLFSRKADKAIEKLKKSDKALFTKLTKILLELVDHPRTGIGHPKPLVSYNDTTYSRHLSANDRIIYDIHDDTVTVYVLQIGGHYDDK